jgi:hypothetical protein
VTASRRSMGRRRVIPARSSVHRCPSRFTFLAVFFVAKESLFPVRVHQRG